MISNEQLVEIKKRNEARTQGEWYIDEHALYDIVCDGHGTVLIAHDSDNVVANRKFAAHAPADITALLEEVERLRESLKFCEDQFREVTKTLHELSQKYRLKGAGENVDAVVAAEFERMKAILGNS